MTLLWNLFWVIWNTMEGRRKNLLRMGQVGCVCVWGGGRVAQHGGLSNSQNAVVQPTVRTQVDDPTLRWSGVWCG